MHFTGSRVAAILAALALVACKGIQPTNGPEPFRGEFPLYQDGGYEAPYDGPSYDAPNDGPGYDGPGYDGAGYDGAGYDGAGYDGPGYGPPPNEPPVSGYDERGYAAPEDYHWYSGGEYRRETRGYATGQGEYEAGSSGHGAGYVYKYRLKDRVIRLRETHQRELHEGGSAAPPVPYSYSEGYEERAVETYRKPVRAKVKKRAPVRAKTCICRYEKRVEDLRDRMHDRRVHVEGFDNGYRLEMPADILFALDSDIIKPEARGIIRNVAGGLKSDRGAAIDVNGYADSSGTEEHNDLLSQSRAVAVADALVREGLAPARIDPRGFGESMLRVPTGDGVREPLNRRVEIVVVPAES